MSVVRTLRKKIAKVPRAPLREPGTKQNRQLSVQTRKILGRHYAAKYRVR
jgi:hypothetical protein